MNLFLDIAATLYEAKNFYDIGKIIITILQKLANNQLINGKIGIYDKESDEYKIYYDSDENSESDYPDREIYKIVHSSCKFSEIKYFSKIVADNRTKLIIQDNHSKESLKIHSAQKKFEPHAMMWIPLVYSDDFLGIISLASKPINSFTDEIVQTIEGIAKLTSIKVNELFTSNNIFKSNQALGESEKKYRTLIHNIEAAVIVHGSDTKILIANSMAQELLGLSEDQLLGKTAIDPAWHFCLEDGTAMPLEKYPVNQVLESHKALRNIIAGVHRPHKENDVWVLINADPVFEKDTEIVQVIVTFVDITDRKRAEEVLRESEEKYKTLIEQASDGIFISDTEGNYIDVNSGACKMLGYSRSEILSLNMKQIISEEDLVKQKNIFDRLMKGENVIAERKIRCKNGAYLNTELNAKMLPDGRFCAFVRDITERKQTEVALLEATENLKATLNAIPDLMFEVDYSGLIYDYRAPTHDLLYTLPENFLGKKISDILPENVSTIILQAVLDASKYGWHRGSIYSLNLPAGQFWFELSIAIKGELHSEDARFIALVRNITERKRTEEALQESEEIFNQFLNHSPVYVFFKDENIKAIRLSNNYEKWLGRPISEMLGKDMNDLFPSAQAKKMIADDLKILKERKIIEVEEELDNRFYSTIKFPVYRTGKPDYIAGFTIDITERKQAEEEVISSLSLLNASLESTADGILIVNEVGKITKWNKKFADMWQLSKELLSTGVDENVISNILSELSNPEQFLAKVNHLYANPEESSFDQLDFLDGRIFERYSQPQRIGDRIVGRVWSFRDITERKGIEKALRLTQFAIDNAADMIFWITPDAHIVDVNEAACHLLGYTREELIRCYVHDLDINYNTEIWPQHFAELRDQRSLTFETIQKAKDGRLIPVEVTANYVQFDNKELNCAFVRDISDRKYSEEALRESEQRFKSIYHQSPIGQELHDQDGKLVDVNPAWMEIFGVENVEEVKGFNLFDDPNIPSDAKEKLLSGESVAFESCFDFDSVKSMSLFKTRKTGLCYLDYSITQWLFHEDTESGYLVHVIDITKQINSEMKRRENEKRLKKAEIIGKLGNIEIDLITGKVIWSDQVYEIYGLERKTFVPTLMNFIDLVHPDDVNKVNEYFNAQLKKYGNFDIEYKIINKQGETRWVRSVAEVQFDEKQRPIKLFGIFQDISNRKLYEQTLKENEERLLYINKAVESTSDAIGISDAQGHHFYQNKATSILFEYETAEEMEAAGGGAIVVKDPDVAKEMFGNIMNGKSWSGELEMVTKSGRVFHAYERADAIKDSEGNIQGLIGIITDITEHKKAELNLKESEAKLKAIFECSKEALGVSKKGVHIFANPAFLKLFGYESNEKVIGTSILDNIAPIYHQEIIQNVQRRSAGEQVTTYYEIRGRKTDSIEFDMEVNISTYEIDGEVYTLLNIRDLTDRKQMEADRIKLQNLESLGVFAGGIAHDYNNLLTSIMGSASLVQLNMKDEKDRKSLERIIESSKKATLLTRQLLTFAVGGSPIKKEITIREIIENAIGFSLDKSNIKIKTNFNEKLILAADPEQLTQAIRNVINNAKESMVDGGEIVISTSDILDKEMPFIKITVEDTGVGIKKENINKIFDPYFSTKPKGYEKGSGLGLSVTYSIIKKHGGKITVSSEEGKGATFEILLPAIKHENKPVIEERKIQERIQSIKKLNILIMDDEELIREVLSDLLIYLGHDVTTSNKGEEALEYYTDSIKKNEPYDLVILDLKIVGGMGGKETINKLREINPGVKAIVSSGYSEGTLSGYKEYGFDAKLGKPYTLKELKDVLNKVVNELG